MSWWWAVVAMFALVGGTFGATAVAIYMASQIQHEPKTDDPVRSDN